MRRFLPMGLLPAVLLFASCDDSTTTGPGDLPPTLEDIEVSVAKNTSLSELIPVVDPDGDPLFYTLTQSPNHGTVTLVPAAGGVTVTYTPFTGFSGSDALEFSVSDGKSTSEGRVDITVVDADPTGLVGGTFERPAADQGSVTVQVSATDPDGDALSFEVVRAPRGGTVSEFFPGSLGGTTHPAGTTTAIATYTARAGFDEGDDFTVVATDGTNVVGPVTVTITVNGVPVASEVSASTPRGTPVVLQLAGGDPDGDDLTFEVVSGPTSGALSATSGPMTGGVAELTFTPAADFTGTASFRYRVRDGLDASSPATVEVSVVNAAPVAVSVKTSTEVATPVEIELSGSDADGDALTFEIRRAPSSGSVSAPVSTGPTTATVTYTPDADTRGEVTFTYIARDISGQSLPATVLVELPPARVALVVNSNDNSVSVIDTEAGTTLTTIPVGSAPSAVAVTPDGLTAYVTNEGSGNVSVIDVATRTATGTIPAGPAPVDIAFTPDGSTAYVVSRFGEVTVIDVATRAVTGSIPVFFDLRAITISPDGSTAFVISPFVEVFQIDLATGISGIADFVCCDLYDVAFTPGGAEVWVTTDSRITVLDASTTSTIDFVFTGGFGPGALAFSPDGSTAFETREFEDRVWVIDTGTRFPTGTIDVGGDPSAVVFSPDGSTAYVTNRADDTLSVIDVATGTVTATIDVGDAPVSIVIAGGAM